MSEAAGASTCGHCGATNDAGATECWLCGRRDWRRTPETVSKRSASRESGDPRSGWPGCLLLITIGLLGAVFLAFRIAFWLGVVIAIVASVILALSIALFLLCLAVAG